MKWNELELVALISIVFNVSGHQAQTAHQEERVEPPAELHPEQD
jgi:hypothetical protein